MNKTEKLLMTYFYAGTVTNKDWRGVTKQSARRQVFNYVDNLDLTIKDKELILKKAKYKTFKNGKIGW